MRIAKPAATLGGFSRAKLRRYTPEVGAVCGKAARTALCGGREVTRVPTAKELVCCDPSQPLLAHRVNPAIDRHGRYRRGTDPPPTDATEPAHERERKATRARAYP